MFDEFASTSAQRKFLVAGLKSTKFEHLRSICVSRVTWGAYSSRSLSDYQSAADVLGKIAADPNDRLAEQSLSELKHVTSLVPDLVPQLVTQFDAFDHQREIVKFLSDCGSHPKYSLQLLWRLFAKQSERYQKEHALIAIAKITRTNDLNVTRVIQAVGPLMSMDDWHPQYATDEICGILGEKAAPLIQPLLRWLRQQEDVSAHDFSAVARCFGNIGPAAREGALVLKDETDRFEGYELKEFLRHLAEAGTGQDFVPVAMKYIDDPDLRYSVIESLSVVGSAADACVPKLIELIDDEDVKPAALEAIMMMGKRGREAGDKLKSLVRQEEDNRAALALMALFPEERETVLMAHAAKLYVGPDEAEKLKASMTPEEFESLKRTISQKLNAENGKERAAVDVKITITKATFGTSKKKSDVTQAIQAFVDKKVSVRRTAKGFGVNDPKPGVMKRLTVNYTINGKEYSKRFACGPSRPRINLSEALRPDDLVSATAGGPPEVEKVGKSVWRLKPHLTIGIPEPGFEWKLASADPVVYECRSEGRDIWMTVTPMPTMNDFSIARQKVIEDYRTDVALKLKTAGAEFEDGVDYFTHYGDDSIRGLTAVMFHYRHDGVEYTRFIGRVFRSAGSYQFETSAPRSRADDMIGLVRFADLDVDAITRTPVPENIRQEISAELVKLEELFDMKTDADVERMISHVLGDQQLGRMKASG